MRPPVKSPFGLNPRGAANRQMPGVAAGGDDLQWHQSSSFTSPDQQMPTGVPHPSAMPASRTVNLGPHPSGPTMTNRSHHHSGMGMAMNGGGALAGPEASQPSSGPVSSPWAPQQPSHRAPHHHPYHPSQDGSDQPGGFASQPPMQQGGGVGVGQGGIGGVGQAVQMVGMGMGMDPQLSNAVAGFALKGMAEGLGIREEQFKELKGWWPASLVALSRYFQVSHSYVLSKLLFLLCPFIKQQSFGRGGRSPQSAGADQWSPGGGISEPTNKQSSDVTQLDLYIPLMAYITYILAFGLTKGTLANFHPELLGARATYAGIVVFLEVLAAKLGFYLGGGKGSQVLWLDMVAVAAYKFVSLVLIVAVGLVIVALTGKFHRVLFWIAFSYLSLCAAFVTWKFLEAQQPHQTSTASEWGVKSGGSLPTKYLIMGLALLQVPLCFFLTPRFETPGATTI
ncbi:unnamed protein product [Vitrella brassicaformis CCMP3155]|uniref:Uncharacterized protein n=2 Tax=Vitrella brassicaformis TaxID=1169539 RepID=A0A0G4FWG6_VITBC|nr:unnamed protein product [Vitrella brassicaformis CCMP3155]|eukprot:CEM19473.1 unnamed protein product [Vitrella brassicaformis CCMP3155]